jgi:hypothetical protein
MPLPDRLGSRISHQWGQPRKRHVLFASYECLLSGDHLRVRQLLKLECRWPDNEVNAKLNSEMSETIFREASFFCIAFHQSSMPIWCFPL